VTRRRAYFAAIVLSACGSGIRPTPPLPKLPFATDTLREHTIRPGLTHRFIYSAAGPWAIHVLDVDLGCYWPVAAKGASGAVGREKTSVLLKNLDRTREVLGGVNADFFLFAPPGVPTGTLISNRQVITGPSRSPVFAFTMEGVPLIATLSVSGQAVVRDEALEIANWNRAAQSGLALFDENWGRMTDSATAAIELVLSQAGTARVLQVDTLTTGVPIPAGGRVLVAGRTAPASVRAALLALRAGDTVATRVSLKPQHPREAVGGRPVLVRDSVIADNPDSTAFARSRHPRTAVGISGAGTTPHDYAGRRILLVTVDGRQAPYSDGMTLRELASLMLALGARNALNLDGGGSTTLVYADPDSARTLRVANRPSDAQGERPVGDALAIIDACMPARR
jgi:hypothetical protein